MALATYEGETFAGGRDAERRDFNECGGLSRRSERAAKDNETNVIGVLVESAEALFEEKLLTASTG